jgi:hypothetical protein
MNLHEYIKKGRDLGFQSGQNIWQLDVKSPFYENDIRLFNSRGL